ncbi:DEAD/DEAH box helicase family protein [Austwickia chelonae]|uniref:DEAD/DEAH box helicase family protein n=1 Tax=Austwickia chelonae TaxID=100225 RepID=UPI000E259CA2
MMKPDDERDGRCPRQYPPDFFALVIVDECRRGSAAENSSWRSILRYFSDAVQLGFTATAKQVDTIDTYDYFGDPVFSYSLGQGIEHGYLAPYRVQRVALSLTRTDGVPRRKRSTSTGSSSSRACTARETSSGRSD